MDPEETAPAACDQCDEPGVGFNEDGDFLCEDCLFDERCG